jgi:hypothetical protein
LRVQLDPVSSIREPPQGNQGSKGGIDLALQVIGAGLGRTGTASLKVALEQLGLGNCYHMAELMSNPADAELWVRAAQGQPDWDTLLGNYGATVDYPACSFWRPLAEHYPSAKILLSVRDANSWFESTRDTIFSKQVRDWIGKTPLADFFDQAVWGEFGSRIEDREYMVDYFERRTEAIKSEVPPERLLVYSVKEGWDPLCAFLGIDVPEESFPHVNSREETARVLEEKMSIEPGDAASANLGESADGIFR